ncbi:hypothetical protein [Caldilinea sp.]|uniref:hypothetical protein n=1 Tax=Caldilinea sp. TaxID=2293560 RepID=UPI002FDCBC7B
MTPSNPPTTTAPSTPQIATPPGITIGGSVESRVLSNTTCVPAMMRDQMSRPKWSVPIQLAAFGG